MAADFSVPGWRIVIRGSERRLCKKEFVMTSIDDIAAMKLNAIVGNGSRWKAALDPGKVFEPGNRMEIRQLKGKGLRL